MADLQVELVDWKLIGWKQDKLASLLVKIKFTP